MPGKAYKAEKLKIRRIGKACPVHLVLLVIILKDKKYRLQFVPLRLRHRLPCV